MLCFRLFSENNPAAPLAEAVAQLREGQPPKDLYAVEPASFQQIPNAPFAYWVSERIRRLFVELPAFELNERTVKVGLQTGNDDRFLRFWFEVAIGTTINPSLAPKSDVEALRSWCIERSNDGVTWFPLSKGGHYAPYYHDLYLVGNWRNDGAEVRNYVDVSTGNLKSRPQSVAYYFRPGYTYPYRASRMCAQVLPAASLISTRGSGIYGDVTGSNMAMLNSLAFDGLIKMILGRTGHPQYDMGDINATPIPTISEKDSSRLGTLGKTCYSFRRRHDSSNLMSHAFSAPALSPNRATLKRA